MCTSRTLILLITLMSPIAPCAAEGGKSTLKPKVIALRAPEKDVSPILSGPPESVTMKSGLVVLAPSKSVGKHSTQQNEELLIVFEGQGEMTFKDGSKVPVKANTAVYCPPQTEHNVTNTGTGLLRYVYVVAKAQ
jgi:mannose-6-phosphate isomerase-like protein (cupin superfamily)